MIKAYKLSKGCGNIPQKITIIDEKENMFVYVKGHIEEYDASHILQTMTCKKDKILFTVSDKILKKIDEQDSIFDKVVENAERELQALKGDK